MREAPRTKSEEREGMHLTRARGPHDETRTARAHNKQRPPTHKETHRVTSRCALTSRHAQPHDDTSTHGPAGKQDKPQAVGQSRRSVVGRRSRGACACLPQESHSLVAAGARGAGQSQRPAGSKKHRRRAQTQSQYTASTEWSGTTSHTPRRAQDRHRHKAQEGRAASSEPLKMEAGARIIR